MITLASRPGRLRRAWLRRHGSGSYPVTVDELFREIGKDVQYAHTRAFEASNTGSVRAWEESEEILREARERLERLRLDPGCAQAIADEMSASRGRTIVVLDSPADLLVLTRSGDDGTQDRLPAAL